MVYLQMAWDAEAKVAGPCLEEISLGSILKMLIVYPVLVSGIARVFCPIRAST